MNDQAMRSMAYMLRIVPGSSVHQGEGNRDQLVLCSSRAMSIVAYHKANDRIDIFNQSEQTINFTSGNLKHTLLTGLEVGHRAS